MSTLTPTPPPPTGAPGFVLRDEHGVHLRSARLTLRRFTAEDVALLVELDSDPEVVRWVGQTEPTTAHVIEARILPAVLAWYARHPSHGYWAAHETASGAFLGWFHYRPARVTPHDLELGYRLRRSAWGKGFATEGGRALVAHGFDVLHDPCVVAHAFRDNRASTRVMEKIGMVRVREEHEDGAAVDWYGIDEAQWRARLLRGA
jgi:RimJ/RimL family protein N-acetyltransferase